MTDHEDASKRARYAGTRATRAMTESAKHALHALMDRDGCDGMPPGTCTMTQAALADAIGKSLPTAGRVVDELVKLKLLKVERYYPRTRLPNGEISPSGCTVFHFQWTAIDAILKTPDAGSKPTADEVVEIRKQLENERAAREVLASRLADIESQLAAALAGGRAANEGAPADDKATSPTGTGDRIRCKAITRNPIGELTVGRAA